MTKYIFNSGLWLFCMLATAGLISLISRTQFGLWGTLLMIGLSAVVLHYHFNLIHIASHAQLNKNRLFNNIAGTISSILTGITFADFRTTHLEHHKNPTDTSKDPDHWITTSDNFFTIPFKIFYHDVFFWRQGLYKSNGVWRNYVLTRSIQISIITLIYISGFINLWITFWLVPMYIVGFLNGLFLFYFPHYSTKIEQYWRLKFEGQTLSFFNFIPYIFLTLVDISRVYHEQHHLKVAQNSPYFPVFSYLLNGSQRTWLTLRSAQTFKFFYGQ